MTELEHLFQCKCVIDKLHGVIIGGRSVVRPNWLLDLGPQDLGQLGGSCSLVGIQEIQEIQEIQYLGQLGGS